MEKKMKKPVPRSALIAFLCIPIGIGVQVYYHLILGIVISVVGILIIGLNMWLSKCSGIFIPESYKVKNIERYKEFAYFYLHDRGLKYTQSTFEKAIANKWTDVVTMCLLLGISKALPNEQRKSILKNVFANDDLSTFKILIKAGFNGNIKIDEEGTPFLFLTMQKEDAGYTECLLSNGVSPNLENVQGERAIFVAIRENRRDIVASLIRHKVDLKNVKHEGLTPMFFALAQGDFEICEMIYEKVYQNEKKKEQPLQIEEIKGTIVLKELPEINSREELLLKLITTKDKGVWNTLKEVFTDKDSYKLLEQSGTELYARLSYITGEYTLHTNKSKQKKETHSKEECQEDLIVKVKRHYKLSDIGRYKIDHIYEQPKCIESKREPCEVCHGETQVMCQNCAGKGTTSCPECEGEGVKTCEKCHGAGEISCKMLKEQTICKTCKEGIYTCLKCDDQGNTDCPTCEGHGTIKCTCPPSKRKPCPYCEKGFLEIKRGQYVKCKKCKDGWICTECNNTGWRLLSKANPQDVCPTCKGKKKVKCVQCKGTKKVKCTQAYVKECDCNKGMSVCSACEGKKKVSCTVCNATGKQKCTECEEGFVYKNIYLDFNCTNYLAKEQWFGEKEDRVLLQNMSKNLIKDILERKIYVSKVYLLKDYEIKPEQVAINQKDLEPQLKKFLEKKEKHDGVMEILEIIPLPYHCITVIHDSGKQWHYIFVKNIFITALKGDF